MQEAGFGNVKVKEHEFPIGGWPEDTELKKLGLYNRVLWERRLEGLGLQLGIEVLGYSYEYMSVQWAHVRRALKDQNTHLFHCG